MKKNYIYGILIILLIASIILGYFLYKEKKEYAITTQNQYNFALYELIIIGFFDTSFAWNVVDNYYDALLQGERGIFIYGNFTDGWRDSGLHKSKKAGGKDNWTGTNNGSFTWRASDINAGCQGEMRYRHGPGHARAGG